MKSLPQGALGLLAFTATALLSLGCSSDTDNRMPNAAPQPGMPAPNSGVLVDDRPLCQFRGRTDVELRETAGVGAIQPNVRRVWKVVGIGADRKRTLICREADTNLDGVKDVVRTYNDKGEPKEERSDTNYDGKIDTWNFFSKNQLTEVRLDRNFDGEPDEWKLYNGGRLSRVKRDTDFNKKPDTWEMYRKGRLERMGVDLDGDERVDRWDHDTEWRQKLQRAEDAKEKAAEEKKRRETEERTKDAVDEATKDDG